MSKASKRQKLTKEELKEENRKLRRQMAAGLTTPEDQKRIVNILRTENVIAYFMVLFLPPVGIWYIWTRREKLYLNTSSVYAWTAVGCLIMLSWFVYGYNDIR